VKGTLGYLGVSNAGIGRLAHHGPVVITKETLDVAGVPHAAAIAIIQRVLGKLS
jgi:hypothetical protein